MNVVYPVVWHTQNRNAKLHRELENLDEYVRMCVTPPALGTITFHFRGGMFNMTGETTHIVSSNCEAFLCRGEVSDLIGSHVCIVEMAKNIIAEIAAIRSTYFKRAV